MALVAGRSTGSLDVMRKDADSLQAVEMVMALEEQLDGPLQRRVPALESYLVSPYTAEWNDGGSLSEGWVVARHGVTGLFASFAAPGHCGVADHFPPPTL